MPGLRRTSRADSEMQANRPFPFDSKPLIVASLASQISLSPTLNGNHMVYRAPSLTAFFLPFLSVSQTTPRKKRTRKHSHISSSPSPSPSLLLLPNHSPNNGIPRNAHPIPYHPVHTPLEPNLPFASDIPAVACVAASQARSSVPKGVIPPCSGSLDPERGDVAEIL